MAELLPRYLTARDGHAKRPPRKLAAPFHCPTCGSPLEFAQSMWVCPRAFHSKGKTHGQLIEELRELMSPLGYRRWTPEGIFHIQRRIQMARKRAHANAERLQHLQRVVESLGGKPCQSRPATTSLNGASGPTGQGTAGPK